MGSPRHRASFKYNQLQTRNIARLVTADNLNLIKSLGPVAAGAVQYSRECL